MADWLSKFRKIQSDALALWDESIFRRRGEPSRFYKFVHFWVLVGRSFSRNRCPIRASALSYTTLFALIPMLAVAMSVTTIFLKKEGKEQIERVIERFVSTVIPPAAIDTNTPAPVVLPPGSAVSTNQGTAIEVPPLDAAGETNAEPPLLVNDTRISAAQRKVAEQIYGFVQNVQSGAIAGVGMLALIYMAMQLLNQVESTFNDIWGVVRGRNWLLRIVIYWATMTLGALLMAGALGLSSGPHFEKTQHMISRMPIIGHYVFPILTVMLIWLAFSMLYQLVPNTKVRFSAALVGGLVAALLSHANNAFGFLYVSRVVTNSRIYGSLGLIPVFMAGLYLSWLILLFGAQVAYAFQNRRLYLQEKLAENVNQRGREFVALRLLTFVGQRFHLGRPPPTIHEMSSELGIPSRLVQQVLQTLAAAHLIVEISGAEPAYTAGRPLEAITAHHVLMAMRATPGQELQTREEPVREEVYGEFARIQEAEKQVASTISLLALVQRAEARLETSSPALADSEMKISPAIVRHSKPGETAPGHAEPSPSRSKEG
ncbi:MAG TPA: YhjD/YihY/BrkB family envelope integrity protein [Verrucomicrobiae bacterium]|nr:YhjD/YihY/BrkB family envelope integrity protein [Verrucomicrobiae bacterium]